MYNDSFTKSVAIEGLERAAAVVDSWPDWKKGNYASIFNRRVQLPQRETAPGLPGLVILDSSRHVENSYRY